MFLPFLLNSFFSYTKEKTNTLYISNKGLKLLYTYGDLLFPPEGELKLKYILLEKLIKIALVGCRKFPFESDSRLIRF